MAIHSSILAWRIPWTEKPNGLQSMGLQRTGHHQSQSNWAHMHVHVLLFTSSVVPDSLWPHGLQHARLPCPSPSPGTFSSSCPLSQWCHPTISFSAVPFSCLLSFPASGSFPMSQRFASGGQSIRASASDQSSSEYPGLISFRIDWFDPLAVEDSQESSLPP